jgi:Ca2+-binding RTX toxin-like protein
MILDTVAPAQTVTISGLSDNVGITQGPIAEGGTTNDTTPTLSGTLSAALGTSEVLRLYRDGVLAGNATVNATTRAWSYTPATSLSANGIYVFTAAVVDGAGNSGPLSPARSMVLDVTAPTQTVTISGVSDNSDPVQGAIAAGGRTNDTTPTLSGTISAALAAAETLHIFNGVTLLGSATVNNTTWSYIPTLPASAGTTYNITARVADAAGNLATASAVRSFTLDTTAPLITAGPTATGASGISITSNENGTAALYIPDDSSLFLKSTTANTPVILSLAAQSSLTTATLQLRDAVGNSTTAQSTFIIGTNLTDSLTGTSVANFLYGFNGNDTLDGLAGNDTLTGGLGSDTFRFSSTPNSTTNRDRITDFNVTEDWIQLESAIFTGLPTTGTLAATAFIIGSSFTTSAQRICYDSTSGQLFYDSDGNGISASVNFATLTTGLILTNSQFNIT